MEYRDLDIGLSLPKIQSERDSTRPSDALAAAGIPGLANTCSKVANRKPGIERVYAELLVLAPIPCASCSRYNPEMRDLVILLVHVIVTRSRLLDSGGIVLDERASRKQAAQVPGLLQQASHAYFTGGANAEPGHERVAAARGSPFLPMASPLSGPLSGTGSRLIFQGLSLAVTCNGLMKQLQETLPCLGL
jgi:hypothetical protein